MSVAMLGAVVVAWFAYRIRLLTADGAVAASAVGAAAVAGGSPWVALLLTFFASANVLGRWRRDERDRLTASVVAKGRRRDAAQVLANGIVFAVAAVGSTSGDPFAWQAIGAGAIATAMADTWSTEVGVVAGGTPRHIVTGEPVAPGVSGGITLAGTVSAAAGAILATLAVDLAGWTVPLPAVAIGGFAGSIVDSVLGATIQERRWCTQCERATERRVHTCGSATARRGGIPGFGNDVVNLTSIFAGGVITWILARSLA